MDNEASIEVGDIVKILLEDGKYSNSLIVVEMFDEFSIGLEGASDVDIFTTVFDVNDAKLVSKWQKRPSRMIFKQIFNKISALEAKGYFDKKYEMQVVIEKLNSIQQKYIKLDNDTRKKLSSLDDKRVKITPDPKRLVIDGEDRTDYYGELIDEVLGFSLPDGHLPKTVINIESNIIKEESIDLKKKISKAMKGTGKIRINSLLRAMDRNLDKLSLAIDKKQTDVISETKEELDEIRRELMELEYFSMKERR